MMTKQYTEAELVKTYRTRGYDDEQAATIAQRVLQQQAEAADPSIAARREKERALEGARAHRDLLAAALADADPEGLLRASYDLSGTAWRTLLEKRERTQHDYDQNEKLLPTTDDGILKQIKTRNKCITSLQILDTEIPPAHALHQEAVAALHSAFLVAMRARERGADAEIKRIDAQYKTDMLAARQTLGHWHMLFRLVEREHVGELLSVAE